MIRLFEAGDSSLRFARKNPEAERAAVSLILDRREAAFEEALHERHMALLGVSPKYDPTRRARREPPKPPPGTRFVLHEVRDDDTEEEQLWKQWRAYAHS